MLTTPNYAYALAVTFPELMGGVCDPSSEVGTARCVVYERINSLERHCYAQRKAEK